MSVAPSFSHSSSAPAWSPTHGIWSFSCSSMSPFYMIQSFRNGLFRHRSPMWLQVLQENLLLSIGPQLLPGACSGVGFPWAAASYRAYPPALVWSPLWAAGVQLASPWAAVGALTPGAPAPILSSLTLLSAELSLACSQFFLLIAVAQWFLLQVCYPRGDAMVTEWLSSGRWQVHPGARWLLLWLTWGPLLVSCHRNCPYSPSGTKTLPI